MTRNAVWALSNLCRGKNPAPAFNKVAPCLAVLAHLLNHNDADVLSDACWALSYLSDGPNNKIQAVIDAGVCRRLVELLMWVYFESRGVICFIQFNEVKTLVSWINLFVHIHIHLLRNTVHLINRHQKENVVSAALRAVGNIVTGDDVQTQVILNCSALPCLLHLLSSPRETARKEACWAISNITAGNPQQIQVSFALFFLFFIEMYTYFILIVFFFSHFRPSLTQTFSQFSSRFLAKQSSRRARRWHGQ